MGQIHPKFLDPLEPKLLVRSEKLSGVQKWYGCALSAFKVCWRSSTKRREMEKFGVFVVVLFGVEGENCIEVHSL